MLITRRMIKFMMAQTPTDITTHRGARNQKTGSCNPTKVSFFNDRRTEEDSIESFARYHKSDTNPDCPDDWAIAKARARAETISNVIGSVCTSTSSKASVKVMNIPIAIL